jgi:multimeric flavodoxin WrbA
MKVIAIIGSARKQNTYHAAKRLLDNLQSLGGVEYEIIPLSDYRLFVCKGCKLCFDKGESFCPLQDDRDQLIEKIINSDGVVFASPNYSFQVSALMKIFLDRIAFLLHRPCFFGKSFTSIVVQGIYGGNNITKYLNFIGSGLGCSVVNGCCLTTLEPVTAKGQIKCNKMIERQSKRFYKTLIKKEYPTPAFFKLMIFRMSRTSMKSMLDENYRDYTYYKEKDWFDSTYYYPVRLGVFKKITGNFFDWLATAMTRSKTSNL